MTKQGKKTELTLAARTLYPYFSSGLFQAGVLAVLALAPLAYMREVYGPVLNARNNETLLIVTLLLIFLVSIYGFIDWSRSRVLYAAAMRLDEILSQRIFNAVFKGNLLGHPLSKSALSDFQGIKQFLASPAMSALLDAPFATLFLVLTFLIHPLIGVLAFAGALLAFIVAYFTEREVRDSMQAAFKAATESRDELSEIAKNAQVVQAMGMTASIWSRWQRQHERFLEGQSSASAKQSLGQSASKVVMLLQGSIVLGVGTFLYLIGILPIESAVMLIIAKLLGGLAMKPLLQLIGSWKLVVGARDQFLRLETFLQEIPEKQTSMPLPTPSGQLAVSQLTVRPPRLKYPTLRDVSFQLKAGSLLAVIGPSGSGKSTLARALVGLWQPLAGSVRLDGVEISKWDKEELGPFLGYLPQDVELFEGTISENIARFGVADTEELSLAIQRAGLQEVVGINPEGLSMQIGQEGQRLSGGQKQRVGLARAIYGRPRLVVLDEPNANLDEAGDMQLASTLQQLKREGCTIIVISHKKSILKVSDYLLVLDQGAPKLFGPTTAVLEKMRESIKALGKQIPPEQPSAVESGTAPAGPPLTAPAGGAA